MKRLFLGVPIALALASCAIPLDRDAAKSIPTELAVSKLRESLPKAMYVSCSDPWVSINQSDIKAWSVTDEALEFRSSRKEPFRLLWSASRGAELSKIPLQYEVRVYVAVQGNPRKDLYRFYWKDEAEARRAAELFESLRGDR